MPFLSFEAADASGKVVRGTLQADNPQHLQALLTQRGMRLLKVGDQTVASQPHPTPTPRPTQAARPQPIQPVVRPQAPLKVERSGAAAMAAPFNASSVAQVAKGEELKTPELSTRDYYFLFSQLASFFKSGFTASQAIHHATSKAPPRARAMFAEMERELTDGKPLSAAMAKRPRSFYPDMIAVIQSGEQSGAMEEACNVLVTQYERKRKFNTPLYYFFFMAPMLILCGVGGIAVQKASNMTIRRQFDADGQLPQVGTLVEELRKQLPHDFLNALLLAIGFLVIVKVLHKFPFRMFRHSFALLLPIGGSRARAEAVERFAWSMGAMLKGGASPASAVHIAAASVPNLSLRKKALEQIGTANEQESLGSVMMRSGLVSQEYVHIAQNGELTGNVPSAMDTIMRAETAQVEGKTGAFSTVILAMCVVSMGVFVLLMCVILYSMYAKGLIKLLMEQ